MTPSNRRAFMQDIGRGMLAAGLGASLAGDLGIQTSFASDADLGVPLGPYASLVELMRATPAEQLQPQLAAMLRRGETDLRQLTAAGALANAIAFGGCDYVGFHTAMAMLPALAMSEQMPAGRQPLPVLKVLYRNAQQIQSVGGASAVALEPEHAEEQAAAGDVGLAIRDACRKLDVARGEALLATLEDSPRAAFNALQPAVQDDLNVHRFVFAHRTYGLADLLGKPYAHALLRQCVRLCIDHERSHVAHQHPASPIREVVPRLLDQYKLLGRPAGDRDPGAEAVKALCEVVYQGTREQAAEATATALAEGLDPECVGEAISLASNLYVLRQASEPRREGSNSNAWRAHGDSAGVHSSDATNAWRSMARVVEPHYAATGLIVAAYHAGLQANRPYHTPPYPTDEHRSLIKARDAAGLLGAAEEAIRANDQERAAAAASVYGDRGYPVEPLFALMLKYAVSEDGRLHGEKYYHTVREEYQTTRPAFRWRHVLGLARVTASAYGYNRDDQHGYRAAGYEDACCLLGVPA